MKRLISTFLAGLALLLFAAPALAQAAWTQQSDWTPVGPISAVGAGATLGGGWIDQTGNKWSVNSSSQLLEPAGATGGGNVSALDRPGGEAAVNQMCRLKLTLASSGTNNLYCQFRTSGSSGSLTTYNVGVSSGGSAPTFLFSSVTAGTATTIGTSPVTATGVSNGTAYTYKAWVLQIDGTHTQLCAEIDTPAGALVFQNCQTDTTPGLQNVSTGVIALGVGSAFVAGAVPITEATTYTVAASPSAATAFGVIGPTGGGAGVASTNFILQSNGNLASTATVSLSDGGQGGTFTPSSAVLPVGNYTTISFTYTPAANATGTKTLTPANGGLTASPTTSYSYAITGLFIPTSNAAFHFSPANWSCLQAATGGTRGCLASDAGNYPQTWNAGAYFTATWNASSTPTAQLVLPTNASAPNLACIINNLFVNNIPGTGSVNIATWGTLNASASNTATCFVQNVETSANGGSISRWYNGTPATAVIQIQGLSLDNGTGSGGGTALACAGYCSTASPPNGWVMMFGDSINEGFIATGGSASDFTMSITYMVMQRLFSEGYDVTASSSGSNGLINPGDGHVLGMYSVSAGTYSEPNSRWDKVDGGITLLDSNNQISAYGGTNQTPALIYQNATSPDLVYSQSDVGLAYSGFWAAVHNAAPNARLLQVPSFTEWYAPNAASYATYLPIFQNNTPSYVSFQQVPSTLGHMVYTTPAYFAATGPAHPTLAGHSLVAPTIMNFIDQALQPGAPLSRLGFH